MPGVTKEQIERARRINVLDYILMYEPNNVRSVGNGYRLKDHESLAISEKGFYWHSRGFGGRTALDYLTDVRRYGLVEAVCMLLNEKPLESTITPKAKPPPEHIPLALPIRNKDNKRVIAYLQSRGIDKELILNCIEQGVLYESMYHHECVFTGKSEKGKTRFANIRSTTSNFKRDAEGSDKRYGFILPPINPNSREIAVFESAINVLSHKTLCKQGYLPPFEGWYLSLGGTSTMALKHFLKCHIEIAHCHICTDNDEAGNKAAEKIGEMFGISSERVLPNNKNDWNDMLQAVQKAERTKNQTRQTDKPCI